MGSLVKECGNYTNDENEMFAVLNNFLVSVFPEEVCLSAQPPVVRI